MSSSSEPDRTAREDLAAWLGEHDIAEAVGLLAGKPLLLIHAEGDEQIPHEHSRALYERAARAAEADRAARVGTTARPSTTPRSRGSPCAG